MGGPFDWGKDSKSGEGQLPRHIERMNMGVKPPKMKQSGDGNNLPWGGQPKEKDGAYMSGPPKDKGSMLSKLGERGTKGVSSMPQKDGKALQGHKVTQPSKSVAMKKKGK